MIYFDNSATTKPYKEVLDSFVKVSSDYFGNPSSLHNLGAQAEKLLTQARTQMAEILKVKPSEVYFTSGGTESNNIAIKGVAHFYKNRGKHLITTSIEHPSVTSVMKSLEQDGYEVTYVPVTREGRVSVGEIEKAIRADTIMVSVMHVNNEVGSIQPIEEIGTMLKDYPKILFHTDHVQGIGKVSLDLRTSGVDLCSISAHKFHGLKGTGMLYVRDGVQLSPLMSGGNQENQLRSGTQNVAGAVAMAKALRMVMASNEAAMGNLLELKEFLANELQQMGNVVLHTPCDHAAPHILNFSVPGIKPEVIVHALGQEEIYVSTTSACSSKLKKPSPTLKAMGVPDEVAESSIRISLSFENERSEGEKVLASLKQVLNKLSEVIN